jgi:hypothetical protein
VSTTLEALRVAKTIYKVGGEELGGTAPESAPLQMKPGHAEAAADVRSPDWSQPHPAGDQGRRIALWVLVGIAVLVIIMIVVIAVLGATENPVAALGAVPAIFSLG